MLLRLVIGMIVGAVTTEDGVYECTILFPVRKFQRFFEVGPVGKN